MAASASIRDRRRPGELGDAWPLGLALVLAVAASLELLLLRVATRTLIHIPGVDRAQGPFTLMAELGRFTFSIAEVLSIMLLAAIGLWQARAGRLLDASAVGAFGVAALAARLGVMDPLLAVVASAAAVVVLGASAARRHPAFRHDAVARLPLILLGGAIVLFGLRALSVRAMAMGLTFGDAWLPWLAEALAIAGLIMLPLATGRPDRITLVAAILVGVVTGTMLTLAESTTKILLLWNLGLSGTLPTLVYALAGAAATAAALKAARSGRTEMLIALLLLIAGGFAIQSTYQSGLVIAAAGVLAISGSTPAAPRSVSLAAAPAPPHRIVDRTPSGPA